MFLNIKDTGTQINTELENLINQKFEGIGFNQIYINLEEVDTKHKQIDIIYSNINLSTNSISLEREDLTQNIINWLNSIQ